MNNTTNTRLIKSIISSACASLILAACGGGGGGDTAPDSSLVSASSGAIVSPSSHAGSNETLASEAAPTETAATETTEAKAEPATEEAAPGPFGQNANDYRMTFSDEFENGFNTSVWNDTTWDKPAPETVNYAVEDGSLKMWPARDPQGNFVARVIDTDGKFYQTYGYYEIEAKLPVGKGTWPAFWLYNHDEPGNFRPEIDIMEAYAGGGPASGWSDANFHPTAYAPTIWTGAPGVLGGTKMVMDLGDLSAGYHKYALKWEPGKQTYYFDGKEVYSVNLEMPRRMYLMLDLLYGSASGQPDDSTPTGKNNSFDVKYVRVWQFK
ncbi:glycoside hydrolase family 16 protein [Noviherbaspirillum sp.]|uniref:glycoside hydrolase family 16 protein n=1 Tax=Noviherbaspirillum sp. TaxID=1926288 RepID=UPI002FE13774